MPTRAAPSRGSRHEAPLQPGWCTGGGPAGPAPPGARQTTGGHEPGQHLVPPGLAGGHQGERGAQEPVGWLDSQQQPKAPPGPALRRRLPGYSQRPARPYQPCKVLTCCRGRPCARAPPPAPCTETLPLQARRALPVSAPRRAAGRPPRPPGCAAGERSSALFLRGWSRTRLKSSQPGAAAWWPGDSGTAGCSRAVRALGGWHWLAG